MHYLNGPTDTHKGLFINHVIIFKGHSDLLLSGLSQFGNTGISNVLGPATPSLTLLILFYEMKK